LPFFSFFWGSICYHRVGGSNIWTYSHMLGGPPTRNIWTYGQT
jgi:hypothetical protein